MQDRPTARHPVFSATLHAKWQLFRHLSLTPGGAREVSPDGCPAGAAAPLLKQPAMHALGLFPQAASVAASQLVITPGENGTFGLPVVQIPLT